MAAPLSINVTGKQTATDNLKIAQDYAMQGVQNQNFKFKIIAENIANSDSTATTPGGTPYQRKEVIFSTKHNYKTGISEIKPQQVVHAKTPFRREYDPGHPAADQDGYVEKPNVDRVVETVDLMTTKNTQNSMLKLYAEGTKMRRMTIDLMR